MSASVYTKIGIIGKRLLGIKDFSLFKKNLRKKIGKILYHKKYTAEDIVDIMKQMGMQNGSIVCIHSSMKEFYNYNGTAKELIEKIIEVLGPDGTLMMPAFPLKSLVNKEGYVFDIQNDPTGAGFLAEEFRKYPGVMRSINVQHSVCAIGKYAKQLISDHYLCHDCWGEGSPWMSFCEMGGLVFNLGMPHYYFGTFEHCVESKLQYEYTYWAKFFTKRVRYLYYNNSGVICSYESYDGDIERRRRGKNVAKYFTERDWCIKKISNLELKVFYTANCFPKMLELGRRGVCIYYVPNPKPFFKSN